MPNKTITTEHHLDFRSIKDLAYLDCAINILHSVSPGEQNNKVTDAFEKLCERRDEIRETMNVR